MNNKETLEKIYKLNNDLYAKIDTCIGDIVLSRLHQERDVEEMAIFNMQTLMNVTLQHLCWANQELEKILDENGNS